MLYLFIITLVCLVSGQNANLGSLSPQISSFHILDYDLSLLEKQQHQKKGSRHRRSVSYSLADSYADHGGIVTLNIVAFNRSLTLILSPDDVTYTDDVTQVVDSKHFEPDLTHLYHGHVKDHVGSQVHGHIIEGLFQGRITLSDGEIFNVESKEKYRSNKELTNHKTAHSVIYRDKDIQDPNDIMRGSYAFCGNSKPSNIAWMEKELRKRSQETATDRISKAKRDALLFRGVIETFKVKRQLRRTKTPTRAHTTHKPTNTTREPTTTQYPRHQTAADPNDPEMTCSLQMVADPLLWKHYRDIVGDDAGRIRKEITGLFQTMVMELNVILSSITFHTMSGQTYQGFNVRISRIAINTSDACSSPLSRHIFCALGIDETNLLNLFSQGERQRDYCHSHLVTVRDFSEGTVGLAWIGKLNPNVGICSGRGSREITYNTGLTTLLNYGQVLAPSVVNIVFAHEFGHNLGSPHDDRNSSECAPLSSGSSQRRDGDYIMYPAAQDGSRLNNRKYSPCSRRIFSEMIHFIKTEQPTCLSTRSLSFCGNAVVENDEECDCGFTEDCPECCRCCVGKSASGSGVRACKRKPSAVCDPSEGPCCQSDCQFSSDRTCKAETECSAASVCQGNQPQCPAGAHKPDFGSCNHNTQYCRNGTCSGSICDLIYDSKPWQSCAPAKDKIKGSVCRLSCQREDSEACWSSSRMSEPDFPRAFSAMLRQRNHSKPLELPAGSPCDNFRGYCDVFLKCRSYNELGPLARLASSLFSQQTWTVVYDFIRERWYAIVLGLLLLGLFMAGFIHLCAVHTPTSNPNVDAAYRAKRECDQLRALQKRKAKLIRRKVAKHDAEEAELLKKEQEAEASEEAITKRVNAAVEELLAARIALEQDQPQSPRAGSPARADRPRAPETDYAGGGEHGQQFPYATRSHGYPPYQHGGAYGYQSPPAPPAHSYPPSAQPQYPPWSYPPPPQPQYQPPYHQYHNTSPPAERHHYPPPAPYQPHPPQAYVPPQQPEYQPQPPQNLLPPPTDTAVYADQHYQEYPTVATPAVNANQMREPSAYSGYYQYSASEGVISQPSVTQQPLYPDYQNIQGAQSQSYALES